MLDCWDSYSCIGSGFLGPAFKSSKSSRRSGEQPYELSKSSFSPLALQVGTGAHLSFVIVTLISATVFGYFSPANRGSLMVASFVLFALFGLVGGYCTACTYKLFNRPRDWEAVILRTAILFPGLFFAVSSGALFFVQKGFPLLREQ